MRRPGPLPGPVSGVRGALGRDTPGAPARRFGGVFGSPGGFAVEHDAARGDLYLKPLGGEAPAGPVTLFVGTEQGFTYRLALAPVARDSAQVLIRNADAAPGRSASAGGRRIAELAALIAAVARREPVPGYAIEAGPGPGARPGRDPEAGAGGSGGGLDTLERWRGPRYEALVLRLGPRGPADAAALCRRLGPETAAAWVSAPGSHGGRLAVVVRERAAPGGVR